MKRLLLMFAALAVTVSAFTGCTAPGLGPAVTILTDYGVSKYLGSSKTFADWQTRHDEAVKVAGDIANLNANGITAAGLAEIAGQFTSNPDVHFLTDLVALYAPKTGTAAPNNANVKAVTDGALLALAAAPPVFKAPKVKGATAYQFPAFPADVG